MFRKRHPQAGARPGTLLIGTDAAPTEVRVVRYSRDRVRCDTPRDVTGLRAELDPGEVTWIDVQGLGDEETLQSLAEQFDIHPLAMEDVVNVPQRPKTEPYAQHLLIIARLVPESGACASRAVQLSMFVGRNYVITFQDQHTRQFEPVLQRIQCPTARLRQNGADYLAYVILDTLVDGYYPLLETIGEQLELLERRVLADPHPELLQQINVAKNRLMNLRRILWPQREAVRSLLSEENELIGEVVRTFLRDTYDHCIQIADVVEMYRELTAGLLNMYLSSVAHRSNEIMKVLTIMSSVFVPLTFVAGIYGMNFEHMPELSLAWSYPLIWCIMGLTALGMLTFFYRKGWIRISRLPTADATAAQGRSTVAAPAASLRVRVLDHDRPRTRDSRLPGAAEAADPSSRKVA